MPYRHIFLGTAPIFLARLLLAQGGLPMALDSGSLVRMHVGADLIEGRLVTAGALGDLRITYCQYPSPPCVSSSDGRVRSVGVAQVLHLDRAAGTRWAHGTVIGGLIGTAIGGLFLSAGSGLCDTSSCRGTVRRTAAGFFGVSVGIGFALGSASVQWRPAW